MNRDDLIERIKLAMRGPDRDYITIPYEVGQRLIAALSPVLPEEVEFKLGHLRVILQKIHADPMHKYADAATTIVAVIDLIERLAQDVAAEEECKLAAARHCDRLQQRIEELTCEHGKGYTEYCEPCGRINGAGI